MPLNIGDTLPEFSVPMTTNKTLTQADLTGHYTVIYFYPKDSTPGCTTEGKDFTQLQPQFSDLNAVIYGASMDTMKRHDNFIKKQGFTFDLISDVDGSFCALFGVYQAKKNFGKEYMGVVRSTFLFNPHGVLIAQWRKVRVKDHAQTVLNTLITHTRLQDK